MSQPLTNVRPLPPLRAASLLAFLEGLSSNAAPFQEKVSSGERETSKAS